jgi:hypothetical protein
MVMKAKQRFNLITICLRGFDGSEDDGSSLGEEKITST